MTPDVFHYIFEPSHPGLHFQVPVGHHVQFEMKININHPDTADGFASDGYATDITRFYTPTFEDLQLKENTDSRLHFLIKTYSQMNKKGIMTPELKGIIDFTLYRKKYNIAINL